MQSGSPPHMSCVLRVHTNSQGWHKSMMDVLKNIQDVSYSIDAQQGLAYVSGKIEPDTILKMLAKAGKHAELCSVDYGYNQHQRMENNLDDSQQRNWSQNRPHYPYHEPLPQNLPQPLPPVKKLSTALDDPQPRTWSQNHPRYRLYHEPLPQNFPLPLPRVENLNTVDPQCCYVM